MHHQTQHVKKHCVCACISLHKHTVAVHNELTLINCLMGSVSKDCNKVWMGLMRQPCDVISWGSSQKERSDREPHPQPGYNKEAGGNENIHCFEDSRKGFYKIFNFRQGLILHQTKQAWVATARNRWGVTCFTGDRPPEVSVRPVFTVWGCLIPALQIRGQKTRYQQKSKRKRTGKN